MTTFHYEPARYKYCSNFYSIGGRISLIIHHNRIQTRVIVFNKVSKLIWYLEGNILELSNEWKKY